MANAGVEALLNWFNSLELSEQPLQIHDLQDGTCLLKVINTLTSEQVSLGHSVEERLSQIACFLERDCRFCGESPSWHNIANDIHLTTEISKVLLLLVYYDMMNSRCTLNKMEFKVEREIADLTDRFVLEADGCVYLNNGFEAYLQRKCVPYVVPTDESDSSSPSTQSSISLLSDDSPVFQRSQRVKFVDLHTVVTPSVSTSPLQDVMNTPQFKLRSMQRQIIQEREYKDGLTRELAGKILLLKQGESQIKQLQYQLDKIKNDQNEGEQFASDKLNQVESKNESLQSRLHELSRQNQDLKCNTSHMERKVDQLTEENGNLSVQVREIFSQLATSEAEVGRLMETQATVEMELHSKTSYLQAELSQATAQKEFQNEQIQILHGKISALEEQLCRVCKEEKGENMGPVMERELLENEITDLKAQLEIVAGSLRETEQVVQAKEILLAQYQEDLTLQKELLKHQVTKTEEEIQAKQELLAQMQKEIAEQRQSLFQEMQNLQLQVDSTHALLKESQENAQLKEEQMLQENTRQEAAHEQQKTAYENWMAQLKEEIQQQQEKMDTLKKDSTGQVELLHQEIQTLRNRLETLTVSLTEAEEVVLTKEDLLVKQQLDGLAIQEALQEKIKMFQEEMQSLRVEVPGLQGQLESKTTLIRVAEEQIKAKEQQLAVIQQEKTEQSDMLQKRVAASKEEVEKLKEIQKEKVNLFLQSKEEVENLKAELSTVMASSAEKDKQLDCLREEVSVQADKVKLAKEEIQAKEDMLTNLQMESSHQTDVRVCEIRSLEVQVETITTTLINTKQELKTQQDICSKHQQEDAQRLERLQERLTAKTEAAENYKAQMEKAMSQYHSKKQLLEESQEQVAAMQRSLDVKDQKMKAIATELKLLQLDLDNVKSSEENLLNRVSSLETQRELLENEITDLKAQLEIVAGSLRETEQVVQAKEVMLAHYQEDITLHKELLKHQVTKTVEEIQAKQELLAQMQKEIAEQRQSLLQEMQNLQLQVDSTRALLEKSQENAQLKEEEMLQENMRQEAAHEQQKTACENQMAQLKEEIQQQQEKMDTLKKDSTGQAELLHQEIQTLRNRVETLSFSLTKAEEVVLTKEDLLAKQQLDSLAIQETLQEKIKMFQEEVQGLRVEVHGLQGQLECKTTSIRVAEEQIMAKEQQLAVIQQEKTEQADMLQKCVAASEEEVEKLKGIQKAKDDLFLQSKEKVENLKAELSTVMASSAEKDNQLDSLREEVSVQADEVKLSKEGIQAKEVMLAHYQEDITLHKELLKQQVTKTEEEIQAKQELLAQMQKDIAEQRQSLLQEMQNLQLQVDSTHALLKESQENGQLKEEEMLQENTKQEAAHEQQKTACENQMAQLKEEIQQQQEKMDTLKKDGTGQVELLHQEIQTLRNRVETLSSSLTKAEEVVLTKEDLLAKQQLDSLAIQETLQEKIKIFQEEMQGSRVEVHGLQGQLEFKTTSIRVAEEQIMAKEQQLAVIQQEKTEQADMLQKYVAASEEEVEKLKEILNAKDDLFLQSKEKVENLKAELSTVMASSAEKDKQLDSLREEVSVQADQVKLAKEGIQAKEVMLAQYQEDTTLHKELLKQQVTKTEEEIQAKQELLAQMQKEIAEQRQSLLQEMQNLQLQVDSTHALLKERQENAQLKEEVMLQENTRQEAAHEQQKTAGENQMAQLKEEIQQQQEKMDTLKKDGTGQVELLHHEIQTLRNRVETLSFSLTKAEEVVLTKADLLAKQQLDSLAIQETLQEKIKIFQEEMQGSRVEVHGLQGQLECKTTSIRVAEEQIMAKEQQLAVIQQEKTEQADMLQKCVAASEEEVEKLKEIQKAKDDLFLQSKEKVENLKAELSTVMASSAEKDNQLDSLREEVSVQADKVKLAKEGIQAKEVMLAQYQEDITLHKELLKQQVTKTEEEIQAKQELLAQMQKEIAEQRQSLLQEMQNLQLQVDSTHALFKESQENGQLKEEEMLQENMRQEAAHEQQKTACENQMAQLKEEIQQQQEKMDTLKKDSTGQAELLHQEIQTLRNQMETLSFSLTKAEEVVLTKEDLLAKQQLDGLAIQETLQEKIKIFQEEMQGLRVEVHGLQGQLECKTTSIRVAEEQIMAKEQQLAVIQQEKTEQADMLQKCVAASEEEVEKLKEFQKAKDDLFLQSKEEVENLKAELSTVMASSAEKDKQLDCFREVVSVQADKVKLAKEEIQAKEDLLTNLQMESSHQTDVRVCEIHSLEVKVETITTTLINTKQELKTQQDICSKHQQEDAQRMERLQEQLTAKSEAAEHYKTQMEKAMSHYNGKKQLLEESREQVLAMQRSLDIKDQEMKAIATELKLLQLDLDKVKSSEKKLLNRVASLESQTYELKMEKGDAADSLEDDTLEDSLNTTTRPSAPGKSSTPLVRSSERLAARRRPAGAESLESLYFTPQAKSNSTKRHMDNSPSSSVAEFALDSTRKNPLTSSVKRRRTTQVISITMSKTPGRGGSDDHHYHHDDEDHNNSFYSFAEPAGKTAAAASSDELLSLPGYRRSTTHSTAPPRSTSTFCVGAEYEPDNAPDDWMRIAELQARNKACLPHLKSTYPLESRPSIGPELTFTEDDLRMGDPTDTIRRASMMPGQLQDSLSAHRLSYMGTGAARPHRHSLMPGQISARTASCSQLSSSPHRPKRTASASSQHLYPCSPEGKVKASCFPRPLTPKNTRTALSPRSVSQVQRRESTVFTIDNTPKKNYLQKGLNRLRSSTRKSPGKSLKVPSTPVTPANPPTRVGTAVAKRGTNTATRGAAAAAATKGPRKSPRTGGSAAKSPGLTASARKMMSFRMKV